MQKFFGVLICLILGFFVLGLALVSESIECRRDAGVCKVKSTISYLNYTLSEEIGDISTLKNAYCQREYQPSRRGRRSYYVLKLELNGKTFNIATFNNYKLCRGQLIPVKDFINGKSDTITYAPGIGFVNYIGFILAFIILFIPYLILTDKGLPELEDEDEEEV